jgi:ParB family chromosome partitioning protein
MELEFHQLDLRYEGLRVRKPDREGRLLTSLAEKGQQLPIVVVPLAGEVRRYLVIDGYKRVRALKRLSQDTVLATEWDMSEEAALMLDHAMRSAEAESAIEQGWLLSELHRSFGKSLEDLSDQFDRSVSWVTRRLALVEELPESVQEQVRKGRIGPHAAGKYLVPMARASREDCEQLVEMIAPLKLSNRAIAELYRAWCDGGMATRVRLIQEPGLFLKARRESELPPEPASPAEVLLRDLDLIGGIARRANRQLRSNGSQMSSEENEQVRLCLMQAQQDLQRLSRRLARAEKEELVNDDDDTGSESSDSGDAQEGSEQAPDCQDPGSGAGLGGEGHSP